MSQQSKKLRTLFRQKKLFFAPGVFDGISAKLVKNAGFDLIYASGGAIARSKGVPDMGLISWTQVVEQLTQITDAVDLPVIADFDNGYGNALNARHAIKYFERAGVAAVHMEDQSLPKRCGHLSGKKLVSTQEFVQKIKAVKDVADPDFYLIARTDAIAVEGFESALQRAHDYMEAGADMIFVEAPVSVEQVEAIAAQLPYPKLLNMFHSGKTPVIELNTLENLGYNLVIDPSDLQRAAIFAMQKTLEVLKRSGHSQSIAESLVSFQQREAIIETETYMKISETFKS